MDILKCKMDNDNENRDMKSRNGIVCMSVRFLCCCFALMFTIFPLLVAVQQSINNSSFNLIKYLIYPKNNKL